MLLIDGQNWPLLATLTGLVFEKSCRPQHQAPIVEDCGGRLDATRGSSNNGEQCLNRPSYGCYIVSNIFGQNLGTVFRCYFLGSFFKIQPCGCT